ncbi:MAG: hypothetical protein JW850_03940 [Thermoflexales bacterium]|nr:hypothetical protein [Thermoflexales bacterium]
MKLLTSFVLGLTALAVLALGFSFVAGNTLSLDGGGLQVSNPQALALATRTAQEAMDASAAKAIERETLRAKAEAEWVAMPAQALGRALAYTGGGLFVLVLAVGLAFGAAAWVMRRATSIYPNTQGQYPVMVSRGFGWVTYHDPSRGLGAGAVYRVPTVLDVAAQALALLRGQPAPRPALTAEYPANGSEGAMVQVASQAAAVGLMAAATRPAGILGGQMVDRKEARELAQRAISGETSTAGRMPEVRIIQDPDANARFVELLEGGD